MVWSEKLPFFFEKIGHKERCLSVKDRPETVLAALARAKEEGYDRNLIREQASFAEDQLVRAIHDVLSEQQLTEVDRGADTVTEGGAS